MRSMFYWRTVFSVDSCERATLDDLGITTLYVRYLDVQGYSVEGARPQEPIQPGDQLMIKGLSIVPTVFIVPETLRNASDSGQLRSLARKLVRFMLEIDTVLQSAAGCPLRTTFPRLLLDYDWTPNTRLTFFQLIRYVQEQLPSTSVESTIRLWQYRNPNLAGIPPVHRGVLMCYNMENYADQWTSNAVASTELLKQYIRPESAESYPVRLDIAYPIFRQSVHFATDGSDWSYPRIVHTTLDVGRHVLPNDIILGGEHMRAGDVIRVDGGTVAVLREMHDHIMRTIPRDRIAGTSLFSLDTNEIKRLGRSELHSLLAL